MEQKIVAELKERLHELFPFDGVELSLAVRDKSSNSVQFALSGHFRIAGSGFGIVVEVIPPHKASLLPEIIQRLKAHAGKAPVRLAEPIQPLRPIEPIKLYFGYRPLPLAFLFVQN